MARRLSLFWLARTLVFVGLGLLIVGAAVFAAVFFHDRTALTTMPARWAVIWTIAAGVLAIWLWSDVRQNNQHHLATVARRWLPLAIPAGIAVLVYSSDTIYHWFITRNRARIICGALVLAAIALIWLAQRAARNQATQPAVAWRASLAAACPLALGSCLGRDCSKQPRSSISLWMTLVVTGPSPIRWQQEAGTRSGRPAPGPRRVVGPATGPTCRCCLC